MGSIIEKLNYLHETKNSIKQAISAKGVSVSEEDTFRSYTTKLEDIAGETIIYEDTMPKYPDDAPDIIGLLNDPWYTGKYGWKFVILFNNDAPTKGTIFHNSNKFSCSFTFSDDMSNTVNFVDTNFATFEHEWVDPDAYNYIMFSSTNNSTSFGLPFYTGVRSNYSNWVPLISGSNSHFIPPNLTIPGINFSSMFYRQYSLRNVPLINTTGATNLYNMFYGCFNLKFIPPFDTSSVTNFSNMFQECGTFCYLPLIDTSKGENFSRMFSNCHTMCRLPALDMSSSTEVDDMFKGCKSLTTLGFLDEDETIDPHSWSFGNSISFSESPLNRNSIVGVFKRLRNTGTISISNFTNNFLTDEDRLIATNKGWSVSVNANY